MKFGMLHLFEDPGERSEHQMIDEQISLMESAEDYGFDSLWPAEHHFSEYGVCGSPVVNLAAIARTTTKIRLGTGVVVLPFHHPVRVAEDFAMLDHLLGWTRLGGLAEELITGQMERMRDRVMLALR